MCRSSDAPTRATTAHRKERTQRGDGGWSLVHMDNVSVKQLGFWPEYGTGPLWAGRRR